jgi:pimeloyl-ACP methyl ester carboxylesterase
MARFLLVHGAMGRAAAWEPVADALVARGHEARAIDLPGNGEDRTPVAEVTLAAYGAAVAREAERFDGPVILTGHSMGGVAITQGAAALRGDPQRIAGLAYVAAFLPEVGESLLDLTRMPEAAGDSVQANLIVAGDPPVARMPDEAAPEALMHCCTPEQIRWALTLRGPQPVVPFGEPVTLDGDPSSFRGLRRAYVTCLQDRAIRPALQRRMFERAGCDPVIEIDTDHSPWASRREELVAALARIGEAFS